MTNDAEIRALDNAARDLLRLYERQGIPALFVAVLKDALLVRCQETQDVLPICRRVVAAYEPPSERTLN